MLNKRGIQYTIVDAEENPDLCRKYNIVQAPTLVMVRGDEADTYANASNILKYVNEQRARA